MALVIATGGITRPDRAVSADKVVTAHVDLDHAGVFLHAAVAAWPTTGYVYLDRIHEDGTRHPVRSGNPALLGTTTAYAYDAEAPLGQAVSYQATLFAADDAELYESRTATVTVATQGVSVLKPIAQPGLAAAFRVRTLEPVERARRSTELLVLGDPYPRVVDGVRGARRFGVVAHVTNYPQLAALEAALDAGGTYLLQPLPGLDLPELYCTVASSAEARTSKRLHTPKRLFTLPIVEVDRPLTNEAPLRIPGRSYRERVGQTPTGTYRDALLP